MRWTNTFAPHRWRKICRCGWACSMSAYRNYHQPQHRALQQRLAPLAGVLAATGDGKQWQARGHGRPALAVTHPPCCGRAWHQRPACLFPDAAPRHHCGSGRIPSGQKAAWALNDLPGHHAMLLANALAQAQALMRDNQTPVATKFSGRNRPSFLLLEQLTPASLGALIALQEHRVRQVLSGASTVLTNGGGVGQGAGQRHCAALAKWRCARV